MKNYRVIKKFDSLDFKGKEHYFYWVEKRVLFIFWIKQTVFTSLNEAQLYIKTKLEKPIYE